MIGTLLIGVGLSLDDERHALAKNVLIEDGVLSALQ